MRFASFYTAHAGTLANNLALAPKIQAMLLGGGGGGGGDEDEGVVFRWDNSSSSTLAPSAYVAPVLFKFCGLMELNMRPFMNADLDPFIKT